MVIVKSVELEKYGVIDYGAGRKCLSEDNSDSKW